ncbi:uncharacterized protein LOC134705712 [Mytilus trossulus]|uniref:uncharacterized protein LOC134705712 n=1 Tax=Mytilus trossulus TaxID=6551 RepID=UPI003006A917
MLKYGQLFIDTANTCQTLLGGIWTGTPFYRKVDDAQCRTGIWNKQTQPVEQTWDKHLAGCADFCTHNEFTYFGITSNICYCYDESHFNNLAIVGDCQTEDCPGNWLETCGVTPNPVVYQKQTTFTSLECVTAYIYGFGVGQSLIKGSCAAELSYICRVGDSNDIKCTFDDLPVTTEQHQQQTSLIISTTEIPTTVAKDTQESSKFLDWTSTMDHNTVASSMKFTNVETIHSTVDATDTFSIAVKSSTNNPHSTDTFTVLTSYADDTSTKVTMSSSNSLSITESQYVTSSQSTTITERNAYDSQITTEAISSQITTEAISSQNTAHLTDIAHSTNHATLIKEVSSSATPNELQVNKKVALADSPSKNYQVMISGSMIGVGILMFTILIFVLLFKACYRKQAKGKRFVKQENYLSSQQENSSYHSDSKIFANMYNFSDGVNPFEQYKHTYYSSDYSVY